MGSDKSRILSVMYIAQYTKMVQYEILQDLYSYR